MNTAFCFRCSVLSVFFVLAFAHSAFAQEETTPIRKIMKKSLAFVKGLEDKFQENGAEILRTEFDVIDSVKNTYRVFWQDVPYTIIAFGDDNMADVDIEVYKSVPTRVNDPWVLVNKDADEQAMALVTLKPTSRTEYMIRIRVAQYKPGYKRGHYGLVVMTERSN